MPVDPIQGIWWLPGARRKYRRGTLQQLPDGNFELTLQTAWILETMDNIDRAERLTLLGQDSTGRPISLLAGFLKSYHLPAPEHSPAIFHFDRVFLGVHFLDEESATLTELSARIPALDNWLGISGLTTDVRQPKRELAIHFSQPEAIEFKLESDLKLIFGFGWKGPTLRKPQLEVTLRQEAWLILRAPHAQIFREMLAIFSHLLDLLSLLVGEPLAYEFLSAKSARAGKGSQTEERLQEIDIRFAPIAPELLGKIVEGHTMLLRYQEIQRAHPDVFQRWLERYKLCRPAFESYFAVERKGPAYQEQRFLSIVQSLESFHRLTNRSPVPEEHEKRLERIKKSCPEDWEWLEGKLRHSHEPSLAKRLDDLLKPFGDLFEKRSRFVRKTVDTRNYFTHYDSAQEEKAVKPSRLTPYIYRLKVLFVLHCLLAIGLTPEEARLCIEKNHRLFQMVRFGKI